MQTNQQTNQQQEKTLPLFTISPNGEVSVNSPVSDEQLERILTTADYYRQLSQQIQQTQIKETRTLLQEIGNQDGIAVLFMILVSLFITFGAWYGVSAIAEKFTKPPQTNTNQDINK